MEIMLLKTEKKDMLRKARMLAVAFVLSLLFLLQVSASTESYTSSYGKGTVTKLPEGITEVRNVPVYMTGNNYMAGIILLSAAMQLAIEFPFEKSYGVCFYERNRFVQNCWFTTAEKLKQQWTARKFRQAITFFEMKKIDSSRLPRPPSTTLLKLR